jgi:hypothetical protein
MRYLAILFLFLIPSVALADSNGGKCVIKPGGWESTTLDRDDVHSFGSLKIRIVDYPGEYVTIDVKAPGFRENGIKLFHHGHVVLKNVCKEDIKIYYHVFHVTNESANYLHYNLDVDIVTF